MIKRYSRKQAELNEEKTLIKLAFSCSDTAEFTAIKEWVKALPKRSFNIHFKNAWSIPNTPENVELISNYGFVFKGDKATKVKPTPIITEEIITPEVSTFDAYKHIILPEKGFEHLFWYQKEALQFLVYNKGRGLIALPPGVGKTFIALYYTKMYQKQLPVLVVCPAPIKIQWSEEIHKVRPECNTTIIKGTSPHLLHKSDFYIINWDILTYWTEVLKTIPFQIIVADEIQAIGNEEAKQRVTRDIDGNPEIHTTGTKVTKAYKELEKHFGDGIGHIPMSGTPFGSKVRRFFNILNILDRNTFSNEWKFKYRYCDPQFTPFGKKFDGGSHLEELRGKVCKIMYRREKSELRNDKEPKRRIVVPMEVSGKSDLDTAVNDFILKTGNDLEDAVMNLQRSAFPLKKDCVIKWIKEFIKQEEKLLVLVWHRATAEYIHDKFKKVSVLTYGGISEKEKDKSKKKFISDPKILLDIRNIGTCPGVDGLQTVCNNVAFVEFPYTESQLEQAEDRIDRVGQKYSVNIHFLAAANTIDQRYAEILDKNSDINNVLLKGGKGQKLTIMEALKEACEKN